MQNMEIDICLPRVPSKMVCASSLWFVWPNHWFQKFRLQEHCPPPFFSSTCTPTFDEHDNTNNALVIIRLKLYLAMIHIPSVIHQESHQTTLSRRFMYILYSQKNLYNIGWKSLWMTRILNSRIWIASHNFAHTIKDLVAGWSCLEVRWIVEVILVFAFGSFFSDLREALSAWHSANFGAEKTRPTRILRMKFKRGLSRDVTWSKKDQTSIVQVSACLNSVKHAICSL